MSEAHALASRAVGTLGALVEIVRTAGTTGTEVHATAVAAERELRAACDECGGPLTIALCPDAVFVSGELVRGGRALCDAALGLAAIASQAGVIELEIGRVVQHMELISLAASVVAASSDPRQRDAPFSTRFTSLMLTRGDSNIEDLAVGSEAARVLYVYASTLGALRAAHRTLSEGSTPCLRELKRAALRLAAADPSPAWLGLTTLAGAHKDDAGRAVQAAVVAVTAARELTRDASVLSAIAFAALLGDAGRSLLTALAGRSPDVDASLEAHVPAASAAVALASGSDDAAAWRALAIFESGWHEREPLLGPLHGGELAPGLGAQLLVLARAYLDAIAPRDGRAASSPPAALERVLERPDVEPGLRAAFGRALGGLPPGTVIELASREWAVVVGPSASADPARPLVRLITDRRGHAHARPVEIDLGTAASGSATHAVVGVVPPSRARFNVARAFFGAVRAPK